MKAHFELKSILLDIGDQSFNSYQSIKGEFLFNNYSLIIDNIQDHADGSSTLRVKVPQNVALFPNDTYSSRSREIALRDFITRMFHQAILNCSKTLFCNKKEAISINYPGQEILERTSAFIDESFVEVRFRVLLPSQGNMVAGKEAEKIFFDILPNIINSSLLFNNLDKKLLYEHIETSEDADFLRNELENLRLIAFVAEGAILPREGRDKEVPLQNDSMVPFLSPDNLKMDVELPNRGQITGMGIPRGITLIDGAQSQGKSTLLNAIKVGIYNHIPGDGREFVVSNPNSVEISSETGRSIQNVDISPFLDNEPIENNSCFSSQSACEVISQITNLIEAVEVGADVLLIDENTSASSFILTDQQTQEVEAVSVKSFIDKARYLFNEYMVSTIIAVEESENYYVIADFIIQMTNYRAKDITIEAKEIADRLDTGSDNTGYFGSFKERIPLGESIDSTINNDDQIIFTQGLNKIELGTNNIDLSVIEQLVSYNQLNTLRKAIEYARRYMDGKKTFRQVTSLVMLDLGRSGLDILNSNFSGELVEFRKIELAAAINRMRSLKVELKN